MAALMEVTQADRDAAAMLYEWFPSLSGGLVDTAAKTAQRIRDGHEDNRSTVQAFARHRLAHSEPRPVAGSSPLSIVRHGTPANGEIEWIEFVANHWMKRFGGGGPDLPDSHPYANAHIVQETVLAGGNSVTIIDGKVAELRNVLATHSPAPTEAGWQGIASAPKDGRDALVGCWVINRDEPEKPPVWSAWETVFDGGPLGCDGAWGDEPTHWHDMPAPPAAPSTQGGAEG